MAVVLWWLALWFQQAEAVVFESKVHDFGSISEQGGPVRHTFTFTNQAGRPFRLLSVKAACGCTTPAWSDQPVQPGKTGFIQATFDPAGRPGYFQKTISVTTDLPAPAGVVVLTLRGNVVSAPAVPEAELTAARGTLRFRFHAFNMGTVHINRPAASKEFDVWNAGPVAVEFLSAAAPPHVRVLHPQVLNPGDRGTVTVQYDAARKAGYGFFAEEIVINTNQPDEPRLAIPLYTTVEEFFPALSDSEKALAPRLVINPVEVDVGPIGRGQVREVTVQIKNAGKRDLHIRSWQPNCDCLAGHLAASVVKPQAVVPFTIRWTGEGRSGTQLKAITIYSSDPANPVQRLVLTGVVED